MGILRTIKNQMYELLTNMEIIRNRKYVLARTINENKYETYAEVGVLWGNTALYLLRKCPTLKQIYLIDPYSQEFCTSDEKKIAHTIEEMKEQDNFDMMYEVVKSTFSKYDKVKMIREPSSIACENFKKGELDIVFIDDNHDYKFIKEGIKNWKPKIRKGGMMTGHDFNTKHWGVIKAVTEEFKEFSVDTDSVWMKRI